MTTVKEDSLAISLLHCIDRAGLDRTKDDYRNDERAMKYPVTLDELKSQYQALSEAYRKTYRCLTGKRTVIPRLDLSPVDHYGEISEDEKAVRNELYRSIANAVDKKIATLDRAILASENIPDHKKGRARFWARYVASAFLVNAHSYLFWGIRNAFDEESVSLPSIADNRIETCALYEDSMKFTMEKMRQNEWRELLKLGKEAYAFGIIMKAGHPIEFMEAIRNQLEDHGRFMDSHTY